MSWCGQSYQPLPISTGNVGIDRCGNIEVYAAPNVVRNQVAWGCWPIACQQPGWPPGPAWGVGQGGWGANWWWWAASGGIDPGFTAPPWWGWGPSVSPANANIRQAAQARGTAMAEWMLSVRNNLNAMPR